MRSPRSRFETACRVGAFALLGWLLGGSIIPPGERRLARVASTDLERRLPELTRASAGTAVHVAITGTPDAAALDWLGALRRGGRLVTWGGSPLPTAIAVDPLADPDGGVRIDVAAPSGTTVTLRDDATVIDTLRVTRMGGSVISPLVVGTIRGRAGNDVFGAAAADSVVIRGVMVVGGAGWEGKYIVSALEERGWPVAARFTVAPDVDVTEGPVAALDTSRLAAVIAVDSTVAMLGESLERFVRSGGGLILAGSAASASVARRLAPGNVAARTRPVARSGDTVSLGSTGFYPVSGLVSDGVVLDRRPGGIAVAARRVGAGRVIQVGYDDSWRWRMAGVIGSEAAHRAWWSRLVSAVAYSPVALRSGDAIAAVPEAAPVAALVDALGPARAAPAMPAGVVDRRILITLMMLLLIAEWASRRLRGMR